MASLWPDVVYNWGTSVEERSRTFPCDVLLPEPDEEMYRAVDVDAPRETLFRWLCQLRLAPYSYDRIDNFGRQSPQRLVPGIDELEAGQEFMRIFRLESFEPGYSITLRSKSKRPADSAITYVADELPSVGSPTAPVPPSGPGAAQPCSRLLVKYSVSYFPPLIAGPMKLILPPGDLVMMRKQLLELKRLAEGLSPSG